MNRRIISSIVVSALFVISVGAIDARAEVRIGNFQSNQAGKRSVARVDTYISLDEWKKLEKGHCVVNRVLVDFSSLRNVHAYVDCRFKRGETILEFMDDDRDFGLTLRPGDKVEISGTPGEKPESRSTVFSITLLGR